MFLFLAHHRLFSPGRAEPWTEPCKMLGVQRPEVLMGDGLPILSLQSSPQCCRGWRPWEGKGWDWLGWGQGQSQGCGQWVNYLKCRAGNSVPLSLASVFLSSLRISRENLHCESCSHGCLMKSLEGCVCVHACMWDR